MHHILSLQVSRSVVKYMWFPAENPFERRPEFGTKYGVDDGIECGIEVAQPQKKGHQMGIEMPTFENGHDQGQDEKRQPAGNKGPCDNG